MKRNNFWRWFIVIFVVVWAIFEMIPPSDRDLIVEFENSASNKDDAFNQIVSTARADRETGTGSDYGNLLKAAVDIPLTNYFPKFTPPPDANANSYVLNKIQRQAAGQIRLGIDLKGGTSFLLGMNTDALRTTDPDSTNEAPSKDHEAVLNTCLTRALPSVPDAYFR